MPKWSWNLVAYLCLWAGMVLAFAFTEYERRERVQAFSKAVLVNCSFGNQNRAAIRTILSDANKRTQTSQQRSQEEKRAAQEFYESQLERLKPFDCEGLLFSLREASK